jgi:putative glutamine amidotransferase
MQDEGNRERQPRVGIPYRTLQEQLNGDRRKYDFYVRSVENAGGAAVPIELNLSASELRQQARDLDAIVLPGSPADVDPSKYNSVRHPAAAPADLARETTDFALLADCFDEGKPALAICYGIQILNVYLGGSLIQDIPSEMQTRIQHAAAKGENERFHEVTVESGRLAEVAGQNEIRVNSSHHQAIKELGHDLRVTARSSDGIIEAVEWVGDANRVIGVQWHPERMVEDRVARVLFDDLVAAARTASVNR